MARLRMNFISGTIENDPLSVGDDELVSADLADVPAITTPDYLPIILDPIKGDTDPEVAYIIDHESGSTVATLMRGQDGSTAREHESGKLWVHGVLAEDLNMMLTKEESEDFARYYVHHQAVPATEWFIQHNLGRFPGITVVDSAGSVVMGDIQYNDNTSVTISFSAAFAGKAYLD